MYGQRLTFQALVSPLPSPPFPSLRPALPPAPPPFLIVASRNVAFLSYINCSSFEKINVSLNNALWDEHVSFTVLSLAVSPCQQFLLAATGRPLPPSSSHPPSIPPVPYRFVDSSHLPPALPPSLPPSLPSPSDKSRVILYRIGHHEQLRSLYGHRADEYR